MVVRTKLNKLFRPESIAIIGVSEKNPWGGLALHNLKRLEFSGKIHLVNRRGGTYLGKQTATSASAIGERVDAAFVVVPASALMDALQDMAEAGIKYGAIVTSGFAELGDQGAQVQKQIFSRAEELGLTLLGPNSLGFLNYVDKVGLGPLPVDLPLLPHPRVGLVSQSGATAGIVCRAALKTNVSLSYAVALGNEAQIALADVIDFFIEDEVTRSIAVFAESIRDAEAFRSVAGRAPERNKPIVMLKVGVGELAATVAQAHTGSLVGNDRIFDAMCKEYGIIRVNTLEELLQVSDFLAYTGVLPEKKFSVVSISGGACEMMADRGEEYGVPFTKFSPETIERLTAELPDYGAAHNPLDITGAVMADTDLFRRTINALGPDPDVGLVAACFELPSAKEEDGPFVRPALSAIAKGFAESGIKGFLLQQTHQSTTPFARDVANEAGLPYFASGLGYAMQAVGAAYWWSEKTRNGLVPQQSAPSAIEVRPRSEHETLDMLASAGVPVVPRQIVQSREDAADAAGKIGGPVVLKIVSEDIQHKTDIGGVGLNLLGREEVEQAYDEIMKNVSEVRPQARIEGILVSPMRKAGTELLVGVTRDANWGLTLAVGFGGILVELLQDSALHLLPVSAGSVKAMLGELRGAKLLRGFRGSPPADIDRLTEVIVKISNVALALGEDLEALEVNPLWICGDQIECLDALAVWKA